MRVVSIIAALTLTFALAACGGGGGPSDLTLASSPTTVPIPTAATTTTTPADSTTGSAAGTPASVSLVAQARRALLPVYPDAGSTHPVRELENPWAAAKNDPSVRVAQVFSVVAQQGDAWLKVVLPVTPSGTTGWIRAADVTVTRVPYGIRVGLRARHMTVFNRGRVRWEGAIAVGAAKTPTPTGRYSLRMILKAPNPNTPYGPFAFGLASRSQVITGFAGSDDEIAILGARDASTLGRAVTRGSIRIPNAEITKLAAQLPLGTPVYIDP